MELTNFGIWTSPRALGEGQLGPAAALAEELGFGTLWVGGSPQLPEVRPALEATRSLKLATGIVNVWQYEPAKLAAEFHELDREFPGRLLLGIGIGHPEATSEYQKPLAKMRGFFDGLAAAAEPVPRERLVAAALGPKMLDLSFERGLGTHPYFTPIEHTRFAREHLGPAALVAPELAVVVDEDPQRARAAARSYAHLYLGLTNYTANLRRFGWGDADFADDGSDRLLDAVVPQGSAQSVAAVAQAHLEAGADHVCLQTVGVTGIPTEAWTALARVLIG
jgi:probable F420-dependent oxidoreductase